MCINKNAKEKSRFLSDETRTFEKGKIDLANLGDVIIGRGVLEPGWSLEKCVKPIVKTNSCEAPHTQYFISGD